MNSSEEKNWYKQQQDCLFIHAYVQPRASRSRICGLHNGELKLQLAAPPVDGAANDECRSFFARLCKVPRSAVSIVSGETSRHKRLQILGGCLESVNKALNDSQ
ncbi:MAG: DUF167 family protein [Trichlorobacter sp.]|jgi:uncharacterized protein (TIGR00251 family)|nr:DUF167 family protein [Trichlorobacter sp.]